MSMAPGSRMDTEKADRAVAFFSNLRHVDGQYYNKPFELLPWQEKIIRDVYGTVKEDGTRQYKTVWIEIPKKNGKSELAAGAALYGTFADGEMNGEVYGCAADKKQAGIIYKVATKMIDLVPAMSKIARKRDSIKLIEDKRSGTFYEVLSSEAYTKHGFKPSTIVFDEIHAQPNRDLWDVMTMGSGDTREQQLIWVLTTAGSDPDRVSIGWELHEYAVQVQNDPAFDPTWYVVIYSYEDEDIYNEENWYQANPSLGLVKSIDGMREQAAKAQRNPAVELLFRQLQLNQWVTSKLSSWLPLELYDATTTSSWDRESLFGKDCYIGLDASTTTDLSAIAVIFPPQPGVMDWRVFWDAWIPEDNLAERVRSDHIPYDRFAKAGWIRPTPGNWIDHWAIKDGIEYIDDFYNVIEVVADPAFAAMLLQALEKEGLKVTQVKQTFEHMTDPINLTETLLRSGEMSHESNPLARWCFGNASIAMNGSGLKKLVKETRGRGVTRTKRIDPIVAMVLAMQRARFYQNQQDLNEMILSEGWGM